MRVMSGFGGVPLMGHFLVGALLKWQRKLLVSPALGWVLV